VFKSRRYKTYDLEEKWLKEMNHVMSIEMVAKTKLLIVPCSGEKTAVLAQDITKILREDYGLEDKVELFTSLRRSQVEKGTSKNHQHELVSDYFPDVEAQVDIGRNQLYDNIRGTHVALIEHMLTPHRFLVEGQPQCISVNDHLMTIRGYLDILKNVDTLQRTLVTPYLSYVRSHSIDKYKKQGFFQFDSLNMVMEDLQRGKLNALITVDPHAKEAAQLAESLGMDFHSINPFHSARAINPYKLGLSKDKAEDVRKHLRPFQERFATLREEEKGDLYVIVVDSGTESRCENFIERACPDLSPEQFYALLVNFEKSRNTYDNTNTNIKSFSPINTSNMNPEGTYIIIDDMAVSLGTANGAAKVVKEATEGKGRVELWTSHAVTMPVQHEKANDRRYIDRVVCLDTVPQHINLNYEYINASAHLLASGLYKAHQKLVANR